MAKVYIETDELYPDYIVQGYDEAVNKPSLSSREWIEEHSYDVPEAQIEAWERAAAAYAQRNAEIATMVRAAWKDGKRVDR